MFKHPKHFDYMKKNKFEAKYTTGNSMDEPHNWSNVNTLNLKHDYILTESCTLLTA